MLQERTTRVANSDLPPIKKDPRLTTSVKMRNTSFCFLGLWAALLVTAFTVTRIGHIKISSEMASLLNFPLYAFIGCSVVPLLVISAYKKIERKRQAAARGEQTLLANQQPDTMLPAVSLPIMLGYKPNYSTMKRTVWALGFIALLVSAEMIWFGFSLYLTVLLALTIGIYGAAYIWLRWKGNYELVADETGLKMRTRHLKKVQHIPWPTARLFAIETIPNEAKMKIQTPRIFELASEQKSIFWPGSMHKATLASGINMISLLTDEQYDQQLQALHALIMEKTGLALYDLRK